MQMSIYWSKKVTLLVESWKTKTWTGYLLILLACFLFSTLYQYMEDRRLCFKSSASNSSTLSIRIPLLSKLGRSSRRLSSSRLTTSVLFGVNSAFRYLLMLAIMSFNGGVFVAIVLGLSFGYFLFRTGDEEVGVVDNPCA